MKGRCRSEWLTWSRRLFSPQGGEGLTVVNGISCARTRTGAVPCCGDLLEQGSFAADKDGMDASPMPHSLSIKLIVLIAAKQKSEPN